MLLSLSLFGLHTFRRTSTSMRFLWSYWTISGPIRHHCEHWCLIDCSSPAKIESEKVSSRPKKKKDATFEESGKLQRFKLSIQPLALRPFCVIMSSSYIFKLWAATKALISQLQNKKKTRRPVSSQCLLTMYDCVLTCGPPLLSAALLTKAVKIKNTRYTTMTSFNH